MFDKLALRLVRRRHGLPPRVCRHLGETRWLDAEDGARLATLHLWPVGRREAPTVVLRSLDRPAGSAELFARLLAESGRNVVVQQVRGRDDSEGRFEPFVHEVEDGRALLAWVSEQPWFDGRLALVGEGYGAFTAWAALAAANALSLPVAAFVAIAGSRSLHRAFYPGGAFALHAGFAFGLGVGERTRIPTGQIDLARGLRHRPLWEADRVALKQVDWLREWLAHPRHDAYWCEREPPLPEQPPPALLVPGGTPTSLEAQLADYRDLGAAAARSQAAPPELVLGAGRAMRSGRRSRQHALTLAMRETFAFLDRRLAADETRRSATAGLPVRYDLGDREGSRHSSCWPPAEAQEHTLFLDSDGDACGPVAAGRLRSEAARAESPADHYSYDPAELQGIDAVEMRRDACFYEGARLARDLVIAGPVRALLFVRSSAPDTDYCVVLSERRADGGMRRIAEGLTRCRWSGSEPEASEPRWLEAGNTSEVAIEIPAVADRVRAGSALCLEVSSSDFPRFDRNPNTRVDPASATFAACRVAHQTILHDATHPSRLVLWTLEEASGGVSDA